MTPNTTKPQAISSLYVLKAVCAFFVVCCHVPTWLGGSSLTELPVPIFFMITGYFLYRADEPIIPWSKALKSIKHIFLLLVVLTGIYYLVHPTPPGFPGIPILIRWIFVSIPTRYGGPLWYLTAMFWGMIAFTLYLHWQKGRRLGWLIALTLVGLVIGKYRFLFVDERSSYFVFNFVNYALPCFSIGYLLHKYEERIVSWKYLGDATIISLLLLGLELQLLRTYSGGLSSIGPSVFVYPTAALVICICLKFSQMGWGAIFEKIGRDYSGNIYYWHMIFVAILAHFFGTYNGNEMDLPAGPFWAIIVYALSLLFSIFVVYVQRRLGFSFFK